ncbi:MAG: DUF4376 domain-containing protein [Alphaproteobacteria bacterium]|nr:DUF4376 domain-containing protein [Alphaproteobacteria bacterium]
MDQQTVYHYSPQTGELVGAGAAQKNPRRPGYYLLPANATPLAPPDPPPGHAAIFQDGAWSTVVDHRGETAYDADGLARFVDWLGPLPDGWSFDKPLPPLAEAKAALWDAVKQRRTEAAALVSFNGHSYQTDLDSRTNLDGARDLLASGAVSEISWTTADNVEVTHDAASLEGLWLAGAVHIAACFARAKALRVEIDAAPDHAALDAIDIEAGWPEPPEVE